MRSAAHGVCLSARTALDGLAGRGDILAGSRRGMAGAQERSGVQERKQGEGQNRRFVHMAITFD
jgi:hypothetical protein